MTKRLTFLINTLAIVLLISLSACTKINPVPTVTTMEITDITFDTAISGGIIESDGGLEVISSGLCWGYNENPTIETDAFNTDGKGIGTNVFSSKITGLKQGKTYFVRAYATTEAGTGYGENKTIGTPERVYILNSGKMNSNNSTLTLVSPFTKNVFETRNGIKLGDTANSMLVYGQKMYIAVNVSKIIFVTDLDGKIIKEIKHDGGTGSDLGPRELDRGEGKVFVTFQEGFVGAIDTTSFAITSTQVGAFPEGVLYNEGKLYVANSDGYSSPPGTTMSVVNASTLTVTKTLEVSCNPQKMVKANNGMLYLTTWGNWFDVPSTLQMIDPATDKVTSFDGVPASKIALGKDGDLVILHSYYDANWTQIVEYKVFDTTTGKIKGDFITDGTVILKGYEDGYSISSDPDTGEIYIGASDYVSEGTMYVFSPDGKLVRTFESGGINPMGVYFTE